MINVVKDTIYNLIIFITDNLGNGKTGLSVTYKIYKSSDNSLITTSSLIDSGNGIYKGTYTFINIDHYYIVYETPNGYTDEIEAINVILDLAKENTLLRVLGLSDENKRITNTVHDNYGNITGATIKIYPTATDFENDTNTLATYIYSATYNSSHLMVTMGIKRTS
jgi:hypothetical protein